MSDLTTIEMYNTPNAGVSIEQVGSDPHTTYRVDWEQMKHPTPAMFNDVGTLEVKAAVLSGNIKNEKVDKAAIEALEAIQELRDTMIEERDLTEEQAEQVTLGNLEALPEVTDKEVTHE